jgi:hypothetical protein
MHPLRYKYLPIIYGLFSVYSADLVQCVVNNMKSFSRTYVIPRIWEEVGLLCATRERNIPPSCNTHKHKHTHTHTHTHTHIHIYIYICNTTNRTISPPHYLSSQVVISYLLRYGRCFSNFGRERMARNLNFMMDSRFMDGAIFFKRRYKHERFDTLAIHIEARAYIFIV